MKYENCYDRIRKRDQSTTIITITHNNQESILYFIKKVVETSKRHKSIRKIIIIDQNSTDHTQEIIIKYITHTKTDKIILITTKEKNLTRIMKKTIPHLDNNNTIIIEPQLYTYPRQIISMTERLRKAHIIIPNRFHKRSQTIWQNQQQKKTIIQENKKITQQHQLNIKDPTITFKAYKTNILKYLIINTKQNQDFWMQIYKIAQETQLIIKQSNIDYNTKKKSVYKGYAFDYKLFLRNH